MSVETNHQENSFRDEEREKGVLNLDSIDFTSFQHRITSPRSLEACKKIGVEVKDLYFIDIDEFRNSNFELKHLNHDCLKMRYDHHEKLRKDLIVQVREERHKLIEDGEKKKSQSMNKSVSQNNRSMNDTKIFSTAIELEKKEIEKIKFRQKKEIESMIEYEIKMELIRKNNEEKIRRQQEKVESHMSEVALKRKREEEEKKRRENEKLQKQMEEEEKLRLTYKEKMEKEQKRISEIVKLEQEKLRENAKKNLEQRRKQEEHREKTESIFKFQQERALKKQKEMEEKDRKRRETLEVKQKNDIDKSIKTKEEHQRNIENARRNLEKKLEKQKIDFANKQKKNLEKRMLFEQQQQESFKRKKLESIARENEIKRVIEYNKELGNSKILNYYKKQEHIKKLKVELDKEREIENQKYIHKIEHRNKVLEQSKLRNDRQEKEKKERILGKIGHTDKNISKQREENEKKFMLKHEEGAIKGMEKKQKLKRLERVNDYEMSLKMSEIREKEAKINEIKRERYEMLQKKRMMAEEVSRQKKEVKERFDLVMKKHKGITEESLNELFPDDKQLVQRLLEMKNKIKEGDNSMSKSNFAQGNNDESNMNSSGKLKNSKDETAFARTGNN